ncbi:tudor domain-containing protein 1 isoform X1 [Echinops telfairi]|uniref:Tudor domain-containing protein 1 isoform X1 n=4 Tax=Echinops telfairi TaxID=9371 RepID=A0AC55D6A2_ECHTE|nr:tudor domain-containing protein 1 isoform X1 [Echinops telfairi]XP_045147281.1 tudor domain-containing protein 1 isoform X1 [Echinops telfairi]
MDANVPFNKMSRNSLEASPGKMAEPFNFEKNESKLPLPDSLRSPGGHPHHPNFRLKSPESGNKKNSFLLGEQAKQYLARQEDLAGSSSPKGINGEMGPAKGDWETGNSVSPLNAGNTSPPQNISARPSNAVPPTKSKRASKLIEKSLSLNNPALFNSLGPPLRPTTCHRCGLFGSLRCSQCKQTYYCSIACQRRDWSAHSIVCKPVQQNVHKPEDNNVPFEAKNMEMKTEDDNPLGLTKEIAPCAEKIMFSDLRSLQLRKSMEIKGTITEFKNPSDFYVQMYSSEILEYMNKLSVSLKEMYASLLEEDYIPVKGEVCVAKYTVDQTWNRVIIQDVDMLQKKARVLYIDYGNEEVIPVNRIHPLSRHIDLFPPCAIKCFVASVVPADGTWSIDCIRTIRGLLMEQYCSVKIVDILQEDTLAFAVDLKLLSSGKPLDRALVEMGYGLQPMPQGADQNDCEDAGNGSAEDQMVVDRHDLIPKVLTLNVGEEFCGVVAHIQTPEDFFCQQLQSGHKLAELQASLSEYCGRLSPRGDFFPTIGDICCAQFSEDDQWYRASVLAYASEDSVLVGYVDYGNFEILSLTRLCPITPKLLELPMQAIKCVLAGVKPSLGIWTPEATCLMKKVVQNKMISVTVVDKLESSSLVELVDRSVTPHVSVARVLVEAGFAVGGKDIVTSHTSDLKDACVPLRVEAKASLAEEWTWVELALDQTVEVAVCVIYSPAEFYCHVLQDDALNKLEELNKSLAEYCQQKLPNGFKPEIGQPCCAFFTGDGNWYRALVKDVLPSGHAKVHFVDYGNMEEVTAHELQKIPPRFLKLPFQGLQCWLVDTPKSQPWTEDATARFQASVMGTKLHARVVEITDDGVGLELTDLSTSYPKIISDVLVGDEEVSISASPARDRPRSRPASRGGPQGDVHSPQAPPSAKQWRTVELPVNKTVQAHVLEIISPNLFYAIPNEVPEDQEKLCALAAELLEYGNAQRSPPDYLPRIGDACCSQYTGDDLWYRAIVLGTSDARVKVLYADYGNVETLPLSRVKPASASHLTLPFQVIKCSLEGLMELNGSCSQLIIELLKTFMLNQNVMISVRGVTQNVHTVSVEKCSENGPANLADKLVCGLTTNTPKKQNAFHTEKTTGRADCCCELLQKQVEKHEQILRFLLNNPTSQNKFIEMKKLLSYAEPPPLFALW